MSPTLGTHSCSKIIVATMTRSMSKVQQARTDSEQRRDTRTLLPLDKYCDHHCHYYHQLIFGNWDLWGPGRKRRISWGVVGIGTPPRKVGLASASPGFAWGPALGGSQAIFTRAKRCSGALLKYCSSCGVSADEARCLSNCDKRGGAPWWVQ